MSAADMDRDFKSLANVRDPFPLYRWLRETWSKIPPWLATRLSTTVARYLT